jgi:hypothetical protein
VISWVDSEWLVRIINKEEKKKSGGNVQNRCVGVFEKRSRKTPKFPPLDAQKKRTP